MIPLFDWKQPGKERAIEEFLHGGLALVEAELATITWCGIKLGPLTYGIVDIFLNDAGRQAHLNGSCPVMDMFTRRIVGFGVEPANIDDVSVCRMFTCAIAGQAKPKRVSTDHDPLFRFHRWLANLRVLEID